MVLPAISGTCQFISGSLERPVSTAWTSGYISRKHSSNESNPDLEPNTPYHGVQTWAGIIRHWGLDSNARETKSRGGYFQGGPPVGIKPAVFGQALVEGIHGFKIRGKQQQVQPSGPAPLAVNTANFGPQHEVNTIGLVKFRRSKLVVEGVNPRRSSSSHAGCVKSAEARRSMPFSWAQAVKLSRERYLLVA